MAPSVLKVFKHMKDLLQGLFKNTSDLKVLKNLYFGTIFLKFKAWCIFEILSYLISFKYCKKHKNIKNYSSYKSLLKYLILN